MKANGKVLLTIVSALAVLVAGSHLTTNAVASSEKVTLTYWIYTQPEATEKAMGTLIAQYMKTHPNVEIKRQIFGGSLIDFDTKFKMAISAGRGPDIIKNHSLAHYPYFAAGLLKLPPQYVADYVEKQAVNEAVRDVAKSKGTLYAVPSTWSGLSVIYNKSMLAEAGLSLPPSDWDWDMILNYAKKLTKYNSQGEVTRAGFSFRKTGHPGGILAKFSPFFFSAGVPEGLTFWTEDLRKTIINTTPARIALQFYLDALYKYKIDSLQVKSDYKGFSERTVAMLHRGCWVSAYLKEYAPDLDFGAVHTPIYEFPQFRSNILGGNVYMVTRDCEHPKEAWEYIYWLVQPEQATYYTKESTYLPAYKGAAQKEYFQEHPVYRIGLRQKVRPEAHLAPLYELENILGSYIEKVCYRKLSIEEALKRAEEECNKILKETWE